MPCNCTDSHLAAFYHGDSASILGESSWDLQWTKQAMSYELL